MRLVPPHLAALLAALMTIVAGCSINPSKSELMHHVMGLSIEHFQHAVTVKDDAYEQFAVLTSKNGFVPPRHLTQKNWSDEYLRGFIDKKTGAHSYQVYVIIDRWGWDWIKPFQANFGKPLTSEKTVRIGREKVCNRKKSPCVRREIVGFSLPEHELRRVVDNATPQDLKSRVWLFKIKTKDGSDYNSGLPLAEIIGLYRAMQAYQPVTMH